LKGINSTLQKAIRHYESIKKALTKFFENEKRLEREGKPYDDPEATGLLLFLFIVVWILALEFGKPP